MLRACSKGGLAARGHAPDDGAPGRATRKVQRGHWDEPSRCASNRLVLAALTASLAEARRAGETFPDAWARAVDRAVKLAPTTVERQQWRNVFADDAVRIEWARAWRREDPSPVVAALLPDAA